MRAAILWGALAAWALLAVILLAFPVDAHGSADWIRQGGFRSPEGVRCCDVRDCAALAEGDVKATPAGWLIQSRSETVSFAETQRSIDHQFWLCRDLTTDKRRCFFAPSVGA